jgi:hypothetical protein
MIFIHRTVVFPGTFGLLLRRRKKKKKKEIQLGHFRRVSCAEAIVSKLWQTRKRSILRNQKTWFLWTSLIDANARHMRRNHATTPRATWLQM